MEKIKFLKNSHVTIEDQAGRCIEDWHFEKGVSWETTQDIASRLIREGVAVPDKEFGAPVPANPGV